MFKSLSFLLTLLIVSPVFAEAADADTVTGLVAFEIKDQFDELHSAQDFEGRGLLIIAADSAGSGFTSQWSQELAASIAKHGLDERIDVVGMANLQGVPSFVRKRVRRSFSTDPQDRTLLDWKGLFAESYGFEDRHCNMLLFGENGELLFQGAGRELIPEIVARFESALGAGFGSEAATAAGLY